MFVIIISIIVLQSCSSSARLVQFALLYCINTSFINLLVTVFVWTTCIDILKRTDSNQPDYMELTKAIAALEEVLTLVVCDWVLCACCEIFHY